MSYPNQYGHHQQHYNHSQQHSYQPQYSQSPMQYSSHPSSSQHYPAQHQPPPQHGYPSAQYSSTSGNGHHAATNNNGYQPIDVIAPMPPPAHSTPAYASGYGQQATQPLLNHNPHQPHVSGPPDYEERIRNAYHKAEPILNSDVAQKVKPIAMLTDAVGKKRAIERYEESKRRPFWSLLCPLFCPICPARIWGLILWPFLLVWWVLPELCSPLFGLCLNFSL
eukprot:TRINITY_DN2147_c0_g1_i1.p1 TRINITY_DN2147_c0_g1~~TRINITY_DN2147_c0_g1_i1.p1  ORF type:complete len:222 (-),score=18.91 TRINITY_DN2147_c0_g1_i1:260-925(-)